MHAIVKDDTRAQLPLASRLDQVGSPMMALVAKTAELKASGATVIGLAAGEPDFDTPPHIVEAAIAAMRNGQTRYTPVDGTKALKEAVIAKFARENGLSYRLDEVIVGAGGKQIIFDAFMATVEHGDEVIVPTPAYPAYGEITHLCGGTPVLIVCDQGSGFKLAPEQLEAAITPRTKWLVLNSPSNPTGVAYSGAELAQLAAVLARHPHVFVLSDDIYEHLLFSSNVFTTLANVLPEMRDRTLIVNGVSKAYCMTGWRIGYGAGPSRLIKAMGRVQSQSTSNPCSISQAAALAALTGPQDFLVTLQTAYHSRRDFVVRKLNDNPHISCLLPDGAFYAFPSCAATIGKTSHSGLIGSDTDFSGYLLAEAGVVVVPGSVFNAPGHFRLSFAASDQELSDACERIADFCRTLT